MSDRQRRRMYETRKADTTRTSGRIRGYRELPGTARCPDCGGEWKPVCRTRGCDGARRPDRRGYDRSYQRGAR